MTLLALAPMYNVTDTVFRQIIDSCAAPDLFMTEFVNVDGLQSTGRDKLLPYLYKEVTATPIWAQIWGKEPQNYYQVAQELRQQGFAGIDINMGCPDKAVVKSNNCSALIQPANRALAAAIIQATKEGAYPLPVSVKTRLGFTETDYSWHEFLLEQNISMLTVHGRTRSEMSKVPARWHEIGVIKALALQIAPDTKIIGNGDINSRQQALSLSQKYNWDGAMIGRAIFEDPFLFATISPWSQLTAIQKIQLYLKHLTLFQTTYSTGQRAFAPLKKFMKVYLRGFNQAQQLRFRIANTHNLEQAKTVLNQYLDILKEDSR